MGISAGGYHPNVIGSGRMMIFIDGENLVARYQALLTSGRKPRDDIFHIKDVAVWHESFSFITHGFTVLRASYYTSAAADEQKLAEIKSSIKAQSFFAARNKGPLISSLDQLPRKLTPVVLKRQPNSRGSKGVDIQLAVDALSHVYKNNVEAVYIMSGDGDFLPLLEEALRQGKQVYLSAFSGGLNDRLAEIATDFYLLDNAAFG
jgi:uncharacterized LabA/DUF88 family protein